MDLARRYRGTTTAGVSPSRQAPVVGESERFSVLDQAQGKVETITAELKLVTPHALFYFEQGIDVNQPDLDRAGQAFEQSIFPKAVAAFGAPGSGPDGDPRISILHLRTINVGGYFASMDQYPTVASPRSNGRNIIYINGKTVALGSPTHGGIVAHELQHLLHWYQDSNEASWVNEGLSEVAMEWAAGRRNGVDAFMVNPDLQLTGWPLSGRTGPHYAAAYFFLRYMFQRLDLRNAHSLTAQAADGVDGVRAFLRQAPGELTFEGVFADWVVANVANQTDDRRYGHQGIDFRAPPVQSLSPGDSVDATVSQFGTDYLELSGNLPLTVRFSGSPTVPVIPTTAPQGRYFWWSGRGDGIDTTLTRRVDLRSVASATLRFATWFSLEDGWDYAYVAVSTDEGRSWEALPGKQTRDRDPYRYAYGPGYTGDSGTGAPGWVQEEIDLSPYSGKEVWLRFEMVTDDAANGPGMAVDDLRIPEIGFTDDAETDAAGWDARGFQRITGVQPQRYIVQVIEMGTGTAVRPLTLDESNKGEVTLTALTADTKRVVIAVSGATDGTTEMASYRLALIR